MAKKNWKKVLSFAIALSMVLGMTTIGAAAAKTLTCEKTEHTHSTTCYSEEHVDDCYEDHHHDYTYSDGDGKMCYRADHVHTDACEPNCNIRFDFPNCPAKNYDQLKYGISCYKFHALTCTTEEHKHNDKCYENEENTGSGSSNYESITVYVNGEQKFYDSGNSDTWLKKGDDWSVSVTYGDNCIYVSAGNQQNIKIALQWDATQSINSSAVEQYGKYDHAVIYVTITHVEGPDGEEHALSDIIYKVTGEEPATASANPASLGETDVIGGTEKTVAADLTTTETTNAAGETGTWTFSGWSTTDASVSGGSFTMPEHDVTFVGTWTFSADPVEPEIYTVSYEYTGTVPAGAPAVPASADYEAGASVTVAAAPTLEGWTFSGWDKIDFEMPAEDVVIYGSWTENIPDPVYYTLIVNYVDTNGKVLADQIVTESIEAGTAYTTEQKSFDGYTFAQTTGDATSGTMDSDKEVTYVYAKNIVYYGLVVNYLDTDGNVIADQIVKEGIPENTEYTTEQKSIPGYTFAMLDATSDATSGVMDSNKEVTYIYTKDIVYFTLIVNYVDTEGNVLHDRIVTANIAENTAYTTEQKNFDGYSFVETTGDATSGTMDGNKEVTYIYAENPDLFTLIVNYVDTDGNVIAAQVVENDLEEGTEYTTEQKVISGYTFSHTTGHATSGIMDSHKTVTYVYTKDIVYFTLTVNYVDTEGNVIASRIVNANLAEGTEYTTEQKVISGYTFSHTTGHATSGKMDSDKVVTYVYTENVPEPVYYTLIVNYVDTEGNVIARQIVNRGMEEGSSYSTSARRISGYFFLYTTGDATEGIMDSDKEVTYVYAEYVPYIPDPDPEPEPEPEPPVDIPDEPVPKTDEPPADEPPVEDPPVEEPPAEEPPVEDPIDIPDEEVPMTDIPDEEVPKTGDMSSLVAALFAASGLGLTGLVATKKRKEDKE